MKIDFSKPILDLAGMPVKQTEAADSPDATLATVATGALMATFPDERELSGTDKAARFHLAMKLTNGGDVDLKVEDVALLKNLIGKAFGPLVVGRAYDLLDPKE